MGETVLPACVSIGIARPRASAHKVSRKLSPFLVKHTRTLTHRTFNIYCQLTLLLLMLLLLEQSYKQHLKLIVVKVKVAAAGATVASAYE